MTKKRHIGFAVALLLRRVGVGVLFVLGLASCKTTTKVPIDDAYFWPEENTLSEPNTRTTPIIHTTPNTKVNQKSQNIEYLNVQDTTVTIRINR